MAAGWLFLCIRIVILWRQDADVEGANLLSSVAPGPKFTEKRCLSSHLRIVIENLQPSQRSSITSYAGMTLKSGDVYVGAKLPRHTQALPVLFFFPMALGVHGECSVARSYICRYIGSTLA